MPRIVCVTLLFVSLIFPSAFASAETVADIQEIYVGLLSRAADKPGLEYWRDEIDGGILTIEQLRANIVNEQPEYIQGIGSYDRENTVIALYQNLFHRDPELEGLDYWVDGGGSSVNADQLVLALSDGASEQDRLILDNRIEVAVYYTTEFGSGDMYDKIEASFVVSAVDDSQSSVDSAKAFVDNLVLSQPTAEYRYLNQLRYAAKMGLYSKDDLLADSAKNHADYLVANSVTGHFETEGQAGFTGVTPQDRAVAAGYQSKSVGENVSSSSDVEEPNFKGPTDNLFSAIYHRLGFLDFSKDEVGIGGAGNEPEVFGAFVYNMGNQRLNELCNGESFTGAGSFYLDVCADPDFRIETSIFDAAESESNRHNPPIVFWPPVNGTDIPPAFYEESPDPLPGYGVSGYPVSVQFNPDIYPSAPMVTRFQVFADQSNEPLDIITHMQEENDPNNNFTSHQHALFPVNRQEWNSRYRAEIEFVDDGGMTHTETWEFLTRDPGATLFTVESDTTLQVQSGDTFVIYTPPEHENDVQSAVGTSTSGSVSVSTDYLDQHTLEVSVSGNGSATITFHNKEITLEL